MAAAVEPLFPAGFSLMTVEEYRQLPPSSDAKEELHWGELVILSFPKRNHKRIQNQLQKLLQAKAGDRGTIEIECAFRALPEYEFRSADVAFVSKAHDQRTSGDGDLQGSPELVIEVLSPSNSKSEMRLKAALCLATGAKEFWIVDPTNRRVTVFTRECGPVIYRCDEQIPLRPFESELDVSEIFRPLDS